MEDEEIKAFPYGEGHLHIFMNGTNYKKAVQDQIHGVNDPVIRLHLEEYRKRGITWLRDGGDIYGASKRAMELAGEYGITYRSPVFAIHKKGSYGGIVGREFENMKEYDSLVQEVRRQGGNFIKIMISGLIDFKTGKLTEPSLGSEEIREMIHIAHEEGFPVMIHSNGSDAVKTAVLAGADSIEHGNFCDEDTICAMGSGNAVWVPTVVTVKNLLGDNRFPEKVVKTIWEGQKKNLNLAMKYKVKMALGSDAGAYRVLHGQGLMDEYHAFGDALDGSWPDWKEWIAAGDRCLKQKF